jgi:hypothetical protein
MTQREQLEKLRVWTQQVRDDWAADWACSVASSKVYAADYIIAEIDRLLAEPAPVEKDEPRPLTIEEEEQIYADSQGQLEDDEENPFR